MERLATGLKIEELRPRPDFAPALYSALAQAEASPAELDELRGIWLDWLEGFQLCRLSLGQAPAFVLAYLGDAAVSRIGESFTASPSQGFRLHNLGLCLLAAASRSAYRQKPGCLPLLVPPREIARACAQLGVPLGENGAPLKSYASFGQDSAAGCAICTLAKDCPKIPSALRDYFDKAK